MYDKFEISGGEVRVKSGPRVIIWKIIMHRPTEMNQNTWKSLQPYNQSLCGYMEGRALRILILPPSSVKSQKLTLSPPIIKVLLSYKNENDSASTLRFSFTKKISKWVTIQKTHKKLINILWAKKIIQNLNRQHGRTSIFWCYRLMGSWRLQWSCSSSRWRSDRSSVFA